MLPVHCADSFPVDAGSEDPSSAEFLDSPPTLAFSDETSDETH